MKTKILFFSVILVFLFGCNEKKSKIEIIPNYDAIYLKESFVTEKARPINSDFHKESEKVFRQTLKQFLPKEDSKDKVFNIGYTLYINEMGKVDKIREQRIIDKRGQLFHFDYMSKFTQAILPEIEKWNFVPAKLNGKSVKSRKSFVVGFLFNNGKLYNMDVSDNFDSTNTFFVAVEHMPMPIGGIAGIQKRITYPEIARRAGVQGRVFIKAFIDEKGNVVKTEIIKGIGAGCDKAAIKAVEQTKFEPGKQRGKAVKVQVSIPILFRLEGPQEIKTKDKSVNNNNFKNILILSVEQMPLPIGGIAGIQKRIAYPEKARKAGIQGRVFVKAFIDEKGNVVKTEIIKGIGAGCDKAAQKAVEQTKFEPGRQRGQAVKVQVPIPILFRLDVTDNNKNKDNQDFYFALRSPKKIENSKVAKLKGRIISMKFGALPLVANIMLTGTKIGAASNEDGYYLINKIKPGKYSLLVKHTKYGKSKSKIFTFKAGYEYTIDVGIK